MSPKFALSLLLLCFVLLGLSDAQSRQQQQPTNRGGKYRNLNPDGSQGIDSAPPALVNPEDCISNNINGHNPDRFPKRF